MKIPTDKYNINFENPLAASQVFPPFIVQTSLLCGRSVNKALIKIKLPEIRKIQPFSLEIGINKGKVLINEATALPPATAASVAGNAQQSNVPVDENKAKKRRTFSLNISVIFLVCFILYVHLFSIEFFQCKSSLIYFFL